MMTNSTTTLQPEAVDAAILKQWLDQQDVTLVDVREPVEYATEHIGGSILVPLSKFNPGQIPNTGKKVVVYCQRGSRSIQAAQQLLTSGWDVENLASLQGGLEAWKAGGYETKINKKAPLRPDASGANCGGFVGVDRNFTRCVGFALVFTVEWFCGCGVNLCGNYQYLCFGVVIGEITIQSTDQILIRS